MKTLPRDVYKRQIISHCQTNKPTNQEPIYESEHIIILDSDSTIAVSYTHLKICYHRKVPYFHKNAQ